MKIRNGLRRCCFAAFFFLIFCAAAAGCGAEEQEDYSTVVIEQSRENPYTLTAVSRNNLIVTITIPCTYKQMTEEEVTIPVGGKTVETVYVEQGDRVEKGQLLMVLSGGDHEEEIRQLEYRIARNTLLLEHTEMDEAYDLSYRWWTYIYQTSGSDSDRERLDAALESIQQSYRYQREDYQDAIDLDTLQLERLQKEMAESRIYANAAGEISYVKSELEGTKSVEGMVVVRIADSTECYFETGVGKGEYASYFTEGEAVMITVRSGAIQTTEEVIPYHMEAWGDRLTFVLAQENEEIKVGMTGNIVVAGEGREAVLTLPLRAVHSVDGEDYVYVLGENDVPVVKWIETGLRTGSQVEIVGGLEEGEYVILK